MFIIPNKTPVFASFVIMAYKKAAIPHTLKFPLHHFESLCVVYAPLPAPHSSQSRDIFCRTGVRIRTHHTAIHRKSLDFGLNALFANFHIAVRFKAFHGIVNFPLSTRRHLHIPELLHALHLWTALEQTDSLLASHRSL